MTLESDMTGFLDRVEERLKLVLSDDSSADGILREAARNLVLADGAKRVRPLLVFCFGRTQKEEDPAWVDLAASAELIHSASLLHDDVIDGARLRRYVATANSTFGNTIAILSGDWLLCLALQNLEAFDPAVSRSAVRTVERMTGASMFEVQQRGKLNASVSEWRAMAEGKTGALFEWCARAASSGAGEKVLSQLGSAASRLGVAFQMLDDLKDVNSALTGKDECSDVRNKNLNFVMVLAAQESPALRREIETSWRSEQLTVAETQRLAAQIVKSSASSKTRELARKEVMTAIMDLGPFRRTPGGEEIVRWAERLAE